MPSSLSGLARLRALGEHPRRLLLGAYVAVLALTLAVVFVPFLRGAVTERAQSAFRSVQGGWIERVERGEALVSEGSYEDAIAYLEELDARFPARVNRHSLDKERERILHALGQSYEAMGRKRLTLETYRRAVGFDPRNVANHFALAAAALRLDEAEEARAHLDSVLRIDPSHMPALQALIGLDFERGDFAGVSSRFESYLAAFRIHVEMQMRLDDTVVLVSIPIDGRTGVVRAPIPVATSATRLVIEPGHPGIEILGVEFESRARAGLVDPTTLPGLPDGDPLQFALPAQEIVAVRLTVRTRVPIDPDTWERVATSYRNRLDFDGLAAAGDRIIRLAVDSGPEPTPGEGAANAETDGTEAGGTRTPPSGGRR
jgi:tetratricopeptide (TPR) repeat protein